MASGKLLYITQEAGLAPCDNLERWHGDRERVAQERGDTHTHTHTLMADSFYIAETDTAL